MTILNEEGLDKLTMRRLAKILGIRAASLYWHVNNKKELFKLLTERICDQISLPDPEISWKEQIVSLANNYRTTLLSIRDSAKILANTTPSTPKRLLLIEHLFQVLNKAGFSAEEVSGAAHIINNYVISSVIDETRINNRIKQYKENKEHFSVNTTNIFEKLPADQYPTIVQLADHAANPDLDKQFGFGLQLMIEGLNERLT